MSEEFGGLDILVNNAGVFESEALERITLEQWDEMFATNTRGAVPGGAGRAIRI